MNTFNPVNPVNFANSLSANIDANILNALQSLLNLLGVNNFNLNNLTNQKSPVYDEVVNKKNPPRRGKGERMIASAIPFLISYRGLDCQEFSVFFHILARAGNGNGCFESMPNMSARLKLGVKSLRAVIQRLQEYRLIYKSEDRPGYSHVYEVHDESQWMSEEEIELKRNELKRKKPTKPVKEVKSVNADIPVINNRNVANVERIKLSIENQVKQQLANQGLDTTMFNIPSKPSVPDTVQDSAQGVESSKCLDVYPGTIDKKVENDRGSTVENDRGILNIENTNTKKILKREEKKANPLSEKTSLSETEMAKDKDQDQKTEDLFVDAPVGKKKSELSTQQISYLEKWFSSGALKKVFTIRDEDLAALEEKERKQAEKRQQLIEERAKASEEKSSRVFGYLGCDEYGNKKTFEQEEKSRKPAKMWYAPTEEHPNYRVTEPVSGVPEVKPEVKPVEVLETKALNPVLDAVVEESVQKVIEQESDVLEAQIVAIEKTEIVQSNPANPVAAILAKPVKPVLANKLDANDQKLVDRVETYRNAFDNGRTSFTPLQLQEWAVVDGMGDTIRTYRKSGRILHSAPNDVNFEFICWLNNQHSRGSNQKDDGYALNYIKKMERTPSDWSTLMALVAQWQGTKQSGNSLFRISKLAEVEQENRNYQEVTEIMNRTGLQWKDKK